MIYMMPVADLDGDGDLDGAHAGTNAVRDLLPAVTTIGHAVLALILMVGGVNGAQFGAPRGPENPERQCVLLAADLSVGIASRSRW